MESKLNELQCCVFGKAAHFIEQPMLLVCGHYICSKCTIANNQIGIICGRCGQFNSLDETNDIFLKKMQKSIKTHIKELAKVTTSKLEYISDLLKNEIKAIDLKIDSQCQFIESEIEIRIESLKAKLDDSFLSLRNKLYKTSDKIKSHLMNPVRITNMERDLEKFKQDILKDSINEKTFYDFNAKYVELCADFEKLKKFDFTMNFEVNDIYDIDETEIGSIHCNYESLINKLDQSNFDFVSLKCSPQKINKLQNGNYLALQNMDEYLSLFDANFHLINQIDKINGNFTQFLGMTRDLNDNIYVSNAQNNEIYKLDCELNLLKLFKHNDDSVIFEDLFYINEKIYACVSKTGSIETLTVNLEPIASNYINAQPLQIKILNSHVACVLQCKNNQIETCFYKLPTFERICSYNYEGALLAYDKWFCVYDRGFYVFNQNGKFIKKLNTDYGELKYFTADMCVVDNNCLFICLDSEKMVKINFNCYE